MSKVASEIILNIKIVKTQGEKLPAPTRHSRGVSSYDLHDKAGGLPLPAFAAPNVHLTS